MIRSRFRFGTAALALCLGGFALPASAQATKAEFYGESVGSGARALGMGGAFIAVADDATAASWNPAGLCVLEKPEAAVVGQPVGRFGNNWAAYDYFYDYGPGLDVYTEQDDPVSFTQKSHSLDFASLTVPFRIRSLKLVPQVSYQRVVNQGLTYSYNGSYSAQENYLGQYYDYGTASYGLDTSNKGGLDVVAGALGISFTGKLYVGVSVNHWYSGGSGHFVFSPSQNARDSSSTFKGTNANLGLLLKVVPKLNVGLVFKTPFTMTRDYGYTYTYSNPRSTYATRVLSETDTIKWPRTIGAGLAFSPTDALTLSADITTSRWSGASNVFSSHTVYTRRNGSVRTLDSSGTNFFVTASNPNSPETVGNAYAEDSRQLRFGVEYVVRRPGFAHLTVLPLRAGVFRDRLPVKDDATLGPANETGLTAGFGLVWSRLSLDFAYVHTKGTRHAGDYVYTFTYNDGTTEIDMLKTRGPDEYTSNRLYASAVVRFK